jgi:lipopolysaccharide/colanic/teichoic acid biosynthesis glycosyltransferase
MTTHRYDRVKRLLDVVGSVLALILLLPLMIAVAAVVGTRLGRPIFFLQTRPGRHGKPFAIVKFRTMQSPDETMGMVSDAHRLTGTGRLLRAASLDELPTFWNVLRGNMSLVGPRPLLLCYMDRYTSEQARRHEVRPGIAGLAQVSGRNALSWESKLALDVSYVDNRSLALDLRILVATPWVVVRGKGVAASGNATAPEFHGSLPGGPDRDIRDNGSGP